MLNLFKFLTSNSGNDVINKWIKYCNEIGLTEEEKLGLAYFNAAIPTVLSAFNRNESIVKPLGKIIPILGEASTDGANPLYLYREFYFNAKFRDSKTIPIKFKSLPQGFFNDELKYKQFTDSSTGFLFDSRCTILLLHELGTILKDYNISVIKAFELGHNHSNFFLSDRETALAYGQSVIMSNVVPHYIAVALDIIPSNNHLNTINNLWMYSKILFSVIEDKISDPQFSEWLWNYHNYLFYENKPGSLNLKKKWNITDPDFHNKLLFEIADTIFGYYEFNKKIGNQKVNIKSKFNSWDDFYAELRKKMKADFNLDSNLKNFVNIGEMSNYIAFKYISSIQAKLEHLDLGALSKK